MRQSLAVILALLLGLSLAACDVAGTDPEATEFTWHAEDLSGLGLSNWGLNDVQMVSVDEGWAVGLKNDANPLVLHYENGAWVEDDPGDDIDSLTGDLRGVGVAPNGDVWCVGSDDGTPLVIYKRGGVWTLVPPEDAWPDFLEDVAFADEHNTYVAGREGGTGRVLRFVDRAYEEFFAADGEFFDIGWGDQGYAVGDQTLEGDIAAVRESTDATAFETNVVEALDIDGHLLDVDVLSGGEGWAVGYQTDDDSLLLQRSGGTWAQVAAPVVSAGTGNFLTGVSLVSSVAGWAVGYTGDLGEREEGILLRYLAGAWTDQSADIAGLVSSANWGLEAVSALPTVETWAVGTDQVNDAGIILRYGP